ncbi:hypothetical protein P4193_17835 [Pseudomonas aeruginosa]|nr:hypothetical protein [Pseudomonas aeruginosa]SST11225.1 Uncharacterised protein [Acinetobacter baumannii]
MPDHLLGRAVGAVQHRYAEDHVVVLVDPRQVQRHGGGEEQEGRFATIADRIEQCAFQRQPVARGAAQPGRAPAGEEGRLQALQGLGEIGAVAAVLFRTGVVVGLELRQEGSRRHLRLWLA